VGRTKVVFVLGTRPEAIKLAPVVLQGRGAPTLDCALLCTGQHREMVDQALRIFSLTPDVDLNIMKHGQDLADLTAALMVEIDRYIKQRRPDLVVVQGDTTTAYSAAQVAFYNRVPVAHVEAGLRTWNKHAPFPEEINRVFISRVSDIHFAPTASARENLLKEGVNGARIYVTGNTIVDALNIILPDIAVSPPNIPELPKSVLLHSSPTVLITGHRRESWGYGLRQVCEAVRELASTFLEVSFVYPVHLNPKVSETVSVCLGRLRNVHLIRPLDYRELIHLMSLSDLIISDSGGIQEEAPSLGKPVLVTREFTERPEGVEIGAAVLVGCNTKRIVTEASRRLMECRPQAGSPRAANPYGDGRAAERIIEVLESY